jgi:hypothetical protein
MARYYSKIGDIFCVQLDSSTKKYFQYIINDKTQLNSNVIRVFKEVYGIDEAPTINEIVKDSIDFYAHVLIQWGIKLKLWEKTGNIADVGTVDVLFKQSQDRGNTQIKISEKWLVWKINEPMKFVGSLQKNNQKAEIGSILPAYQIIERMRTGKYNMTYPGYDENSIMSYTPFEEGEKAHEIIKKALEEKMKKIENKKKQS